MGFKPFKPKPDLPLISWLPEHEPKTIAGYYRGGEKRATKMNPNGVIHTIEMADGLWAFFGTTVLNSQLEQMTIGTFIEIHYTGKRVKSNESAYTYKEMEIGVWNPEDGQPPFPSNPNAKPAKLDLEPEDAAAPTRPSGSSNGPRAGGPGAASAGGPTQEQRDRIRTLWLDTHKLSQESLAWVLRADFNVTRVPDLKPEEADLLIRWLTETDTPHVSAYVRDAAPAGAGA